MGPSPRSRAWIRSGYLCPCPTPARPRVPCDNVRGLWLEDRPGPRDGVTKNRAPRARGVRTTQEHGSTMLLLPALPPCRTGPRPNVHRHRECLCSGLQSSYHPERHPAEVGVWVWVGDVTRKENACEGSPAVGAQQTTTWPFTARGWQLRAGGRLFRVDGRQCGTPCAYLPCSTPAGGCCSTGGCRHRYWSASTQDLEPGISNGPEQGWQGRCGGAGGGP